MVIPDAGMYISCMLFVQISWISPVRFIRTDRNELIKLQGISIQNMFVLKKRLTGSHYGLLRYVSGESRME